MGRFFLHNGILVNKTMTNMNLAELGVEQNPISLQSFHSERYILSSNVCLAPKDLHSFFYFLIEKQGNKIIKNNLRNI